MEKKLFSKRFPTRLLNLLSVNKQKEILAGKCRIFQGIFAFDPQLHNFSKTLIYIAELPEYWLNAIPALLELQRRCHTLGILCSKNTQSKLEYYLKNAHFHLWNSNFCFGDPEFIELQNEIRVQNYDSALFISRNKEFLPFFLVGDSGAQIRMDIVQRKNIFANLKLKISKENGMPIEVLNIHFPSIFNLELKNLPEKRTQGELLILHPLKLDSNFDCAELENWLKNRNIPYSFLSSEKTDEPGTKHYHGWNELRDRLKRSRFLLAPQGVELEIARIEGLCPYFLIEQEYDFEEIKKALL